MKGLRVRLGNGPVSESKAVAESSVVEVKNRQRAR